MSNWLAYFGGAVVALLAALFAVPALIDWNGYRGVFEEEATRVLGRDVRLGGKVNLRLLPAPYVSFEKMRISDPDSQTGEPLFRAESFTMWLALSPLVQGVLQASQVELDKPVLKLAISEDGTGNWSRLQLTPGTLPFVPADVMLNSVKLRGGEIGLVGPKGNELGKLEAIDGELIAESLKGPFRYRGHVTFGGEARDVRFASAAPDANGDVRFKVSATGMGTSSSYVLDGHAADLGAKLSLKGDLAAKIAPDLSPEGAAAPPARIAPVAPAPEVTVSTNPASDQKTAVPIPAAAQAGAPLYDMRSKVSGDAGGIKLSEISITSEGAGPPQLITGTAEAAWGERTRVDLALNSRWIDLDAMFGTSGKAVVPLEAARGLFDVLMRQLPASSDTNVNLTIDQLNLGADQISDVRVAAVRAGGPLEVKDFQVRLPGSTQLSLTGKLAPAENAPKFEGTIGLKGQSLSRFLAWGLKQPAVTQNVSDGAFAVNGGLKFSGKQIELANAKVGVGETPITAGVKLDLGERRRLAMTLDGQRIDIGHVWPGGLQMEALAPLLAHGFAKTASDADGQSILAWIDPASTDFSLGIKAGTVVDGTRRLRNVEADVSLEGGKLAMRQLKFGDDTGLEVELEGEATDLKSAAQGGVRGLIVAPASNATQSFVDLAGLDTYAPGLAAYLQRLAPLRIAGTVQFGGRTPNAADVKLDGTIRGGGRLVSTIELDGGFASWRTANAGITARIDTPDIQQSLTALVETAPQLSSPHAARRGRILARATGIPQDGLASFASVAADGVSLTYSGRVLMPADAPLGLKGEVEVAGRDGRMLVGLAGLKMPEAVSDTAISGILSVEKTADTLTLKPAALEIAGAPVGGELTIKHPQDGTRSAVTAFLKVEEARLPGLLSAVLGKTPLAIDPQPAAAPAPAQKAGAAQHQPPAPAVTIWPEQAFDFSGLETVEGRVTVHFGKLALEPDFSIRNARMDLTLQPGKLSVTALEGEAVGGKLTSQLTLAKEQGGVALTGDLDIRVPHDAGAAGAPQPDIAGLALKFNGRAMSPAALIGDMKGNGELKLGDVSLGGMSPAVIGAVSEAALLGRGPQQGPQLYDALRAGLREGQLKIGELAVPVTLTEGSMKLAKVEFDKEDGRTAFETVVDLATLRIDSEWTVEARLPKTAGRAGGKLLPPVSVVYAGMLKNITAIEPQISAAALERELTVRKMERDVEELERLRKEDEQRAKEEQARMKAEQERARQEKARIEAERAAAAAAAAVDDPQPAPDASVGAGAVDQAPLPPAATTPSPQSNAPPAATPPVQQQAAGSDPTAAPAETSGAQQAPRPAPPKRRPPPPPKENWNPFTGGF